MNTMHDETEAGKTVMRELIAQDGIGKAVAIVADLFAAPANYTERDQLAGMLLAAYEAGQLDALNAKEAVS